MAVRVLETKDDFQAALKEAGDKVVMVDFYATWCGPCKMISPVFETLAAEKTNIVFYKVDVDNSSDIAEDYSISSIPMFICFHKEKMVDSMAGSNEAKLRELANKYDRA